MIEDHAIASIIAMIGIPYLIGSIYALVTRPSKFYYVHDGLRWKKKKYRK